MFFFLKYKTPRPNKTIVEKDNIIRLVKAVTLQLPFTMVAGLFMVKGLKL